MISRRLDFLVRGFAKVLILKPPLYLVNRPLMAVRQHFRRPIQLGGVIEAPESRDTKNIVGLRHRDMTIVGVPWLCRLARM